MMKGLDQPYKLNVPANWKTEDNKICLTAEQVDELHSADAIQLVHAYHRSYHWVHLDAYQLCKARFNVTVGGIIAKNWR